jgi:hypothetical protein
VTCTPSEIDCPLPLLSISGLSPEQRIHYSSATLVLPSSSHLLSPSPLGFLPSPPSSIPQRRENAELNEDTLEGAVSSPHIHGSTYGIRKRRLSQSVSLEPSKRQRRPIIPAMRHSTVKPVASSHSCPDLSLPQGKPSDFDKVPQPTLPVLINPGAPVNFGVFDWNSISDPSATTAASMCM